MNNTQIYTIWMNTIQAFSNDDTYNQSLWEDLIKAYSDKGRYYHNLKHIDIMLNLAKSYTHQINNINALNLAIFYHDIIYDVKRQDNELKSWEFAEQHLKPLALTSEDLECIQSCIIATKGHQSHSNSDVNFILDFDLYTLGQSWTYYEEYTKQIRQEYAIYPDALYLNGRIQVLKHFLNTGDIYKTPEFKTLYEQQAQSNIKHELKLLQTLV